MFTLRRNLAAPAPVTRPSLHQRPSSDPQSPWPWKMEVSLRRRLMAWGIFRHALSSWLMICCIYLARTTINLTKPLTIMKMFGNSGLSLALLLCVAAAMQTLSHAATLSVTPGSVSNLYAGNLTLQIGGLTNGETVLIERFIDLNANGTVDSSEPLVQSFRLTDG